MSRANIHDFTQRAPGIVLSVLLLNFPVAAWPKEQSEDPQVSDVKVELDDVNATQRLTTILGVMISGISPSDPNYDPCKRAALFVAQDAFDNFGKWNAFMDLLNQTARGVDLGATLGSQPTVAKVTQVAGTIVEAFSDAEPSAALGRALVNETVGWAAGQAKSGNEAVDDAVKATAEVAKDRLIKELFSGQNQKGATFNTTVGDCTVEVTPEFQWPGPGKGQVGGILLYMSGDCGCKKPLKLNPLDFRAQPDDIKNCGLGRFQVIAFAPLLKFKASVSFGGKVANLTDLFNKSAKLKKAVEDALADRKPEEDPQDIAKELQGLVEKGTKLEATVHLIPEFGEMKLGESNSMCGNCPESNPNVPTTPTAEVDPCARVTRDIEQVLKMVDQSEINRLKEAEHKTFTLAAQSNDPEARKLAKAEYEELVKERKALEEKRDEQIQSLTSNASQSWSEAEKACYKSKPATNAPYQMYSDCTSKGQVCVPVWSTTFEVAKAGQLAITVTASPALCSDVSYTVFVDTSIFGTTKFLPPGQTATLIGGAVVEMGSHTVTVQGVGRKSGCNQGDLSSWAGTLVVSQP